MEKMTRQKDFTKRMKSHPKQSSDLPQPKCLISDTKLCKEKIQQEDVDIFVGGRKKEKATIVNSCLCKQRMF